MSVVGRLRASVAMAALCATVAGCAPTAPMVQYHNVDHPNYSTADFNRDNCTVPRPELHEAGDPGLRGQAGGHGG